MLYCEYNFWTVFGYFCLQHNNFRIVMNQCKSKSIKSFFSPISRDAATHEAFKSVLCSTDSIIMDFMKPVPPKIPVGRPPKKMKQILLSPISSSGEINAALSEEEIIAKEIASMSKWDFLMHAKLRNPSTLYGQMLWNDFSSFTVTLMDRTVRRLDGIIATTSF